MGKVTLFGLENIGNIGDNILADTTNYLLKECGQKNVCRCQLMPSFNMVIKRWPWTIFAFPILRLARYFKGNIRYRLLNWGYILKFYNYFDCHIKASDKIVLAVGMLKFATQDFSYVFHLITSIASKNHKSVMMSAMSIAKPNEKDWRFLQLLEAVNNKSTKVITTRDGKDGLELLRDHYLKRDISSDYVGDPALWIPETYNVLPRVNHVADKFKSVIGINVIRSNIYTSYGEEKFSSEQLIAFYEDLISELEYRGYEWFLFCNGMECDYEMGKRLLCIMNRPEEKMLPIPKTGKDLAKIILNADCVFGARLHCCITSVSLNVPVVGLLWDNKLKFFSRSIGIEDFFIPASNLNGLSVADKIEEAMRNDLDLENVMAYKERTRKYINDFIHS